MIIIILYINLVWTIIFVTRLIWYDEVEKIISSINVRNYYSILGRVAILKKIVDVVPEVIITLRLLYHVYSKLKVPILLLLFLGACGWSYVFFSFELLMFTIHELRIRHIFEGNYEIKILVTSNCIYHVSTYTTVKSGR